MARRFTLEEVKAYFIDNGCILLENRYLNSLSKMSFECSCGSIGTSTLVNFRTSHRCTKCRHKALSEKFRHPFEKVKQYFKDQNCELLESTYINDRLKMRYKCSCGGLSTICYSSFKKGSRCKKCGIEKVASKKRNNYNEVKGIFKDQCCTLLEKSYQSNRNAMKYKCSCGNIAKISFSNFQKGHRCEKCGRIKCIRKGPESPFWNPLTTEKERSMGRNLAGEWIRLVKKKYNNTCVICNSNKSPIAHHLESWNSNKELRLEVSNGIVVCERCHKEFHQLYGNGNNTKKQLEEFIAKKCIKWQD